MPQTPAVSGPRPAPSDPLLLPVGLQEKQLVFTACVQSGTLEGRELPALWTLTLRGLLMPVSTPALHGFPGAGSPGPWEEAQVPTLLPTGSGT